MFKIYQKLIIQQGKGLSRRPCLSWNNGFASSTVAAEINNVTAPSFPEDETKTSSGTSKNHNMIKAAFASIHSMENSWEIQTPATDDKINNAKSINELLALSGGTGVSRRHALKVVSVLSEWTSSAKVKLSDFENDPRFIRLCRILTKNNNSQKTKTNTFSTAKSDDLNTILSVTADEEAAKLVQSITLPQMVKVLTNLSIKKRRSTLLLRTLAYNITASPESLDIKQCADLLYSISSLNFYDENLFDRVANNIITVLQHENLNRSAVIGSILTSVGLLKYKNPALLDAISEWVEKKHHICRPQDIFSLCMTLAVLNYFPANSDNLFKVLTPQLTQEEAGKPLVWLEIVWSLILLNQANENHVTSVLNDSFISNLENESSLTTSVRLKLLNIDGAAHYLLKNYNGPKISKDHEIRKTGFALSKEKIEMINSTIDALKNLISENYIRSRINTGLGFYIDAECILDKTCNPQPLTQASGDNLARVAIQVYDYHDMCKGRLEVTGVNVLSQRLLSAMGYKVVTVPYTEYKPRDKIVHRVKYLEAKLKEAVKI